ncbi:MAG: YncE family protein [Anaerolineales bacterium]
MKQLMLGLLLTVLAACASPAAGPVVVKETPLADAASRVEPVAFECPVSESVATPAPDDPNADPFGNGPWFINADRSIWMPLHSMSVGGNKLVWIRPAGASSAIIGRRLDGEAPPLEYFSPGGYFTGFEVGGLTFPTEGCWEVTATAGESALTFVVEVRPPESEATHFFFVRPEGERGPLVAYDTAVGNEQFRLPAGLLSADGQRFVTAQSGRASVHDTITGRMLNEFAADDWALSGLSPTGDSAVFTQVGTASYADGATQTTTSFKIANTMLGETLHELHLDGQFEFDAISANGKMLFLIERLGGEQSDQYVIRLYDLSHETLLADPLRSKGADEIMAGYAWSGVGTPDGEWLLTLYLSLNRKVAFVHALNLRQSFAVCIALPSGDGDFDELKQYSLTLGPDGKTLYAANTALGTVAEVTLDPDNGVMAVTREARFPVEATTADRAARAVLAKDGRLYFAAGETVWPYSTKTGAVLNPIRVEGEIAGLGANWDGSRLFVARAAEPMVVFDTASGLPVP